MICLMLCLDLSKNGSDYYIAVDIGKRKCVVCITYKGRSILEET